MAELKRKLYKRGSSFEVTIPKPLLFLVDTAKKNSAVFKLDESKGKWFVEIEPEEKQEEEI